MARAERVMPGGVSSPVRAFRAVGGTPLVLRSGTGAEFEDVDGNRYVDFVCSWGPLILGHAHPEIMRAITETAARGTSFGAPCEQEIELAEYHHRELSGTRAGALRVVGHRGDDERDPRRARRDRTRPDHQVLGLLPRARGSPARRRRLRARHVRTALVGGRPRGIRRRETIVLPLDDEQRLTDLLRREGDTIAAVIIEPVPANNGLLLQRPEFLATLRRETERAGSC